MKNVHLICNAHIDPVWLWEREEGIGEALSTFRIAVDFCEREEGFVFNHNEAVLYQWIEEYEPELFDRIKLAVKSKRWNIIGGWYLQPDCNMPSGESIIRQIKAGHEYFTSRFGEDFNCKTAINFDSFGHNRGLVQILAKAGYSSYIICRPNAKDFKVESNNFIWVGYENSTIMVHREVNGYGSQKGAVIDKIINGIKENKDNEVDFVLWGIGNHGGGPSKIDYEIIKMVKKGEFKQSTTKQSGSIAGVEAKKEDNADDSFVELLSDKTFIESTPENYFEEANAKGMFTTKVNRSINPWGVGCYTSQIRIKQKHYELENNLSLAEKMATIATINVTGYKYPFEQFASAEEDLLFSQFHDILPGSSIKAVEDTSIRLLEHGLEEVNRVKTKAFFNLAQSMEFSEREDEIPIIVFNPHPYELETQIVCELQKAEQNWGEGFANPVIYHNNKIISSQTEKEDSNINLDWRKKIVFNAILPPMQMTKYICKFEMIDKRKRESLEIINDCYVFDNGRLKAYININNGLLEKCIYDNKEHMINSFLPSVYSDNDDPWGMTVNSFQEKIGEFSLMYKDAVLEFSGAKFNPDKTDGIYTSITSDTSKTCVRVIENGDIRTVIEAVFQYNNSIICQKYILPKTGNEIDFELTVWWNEAAKMLKLEVPFAQNDAKYYGQGMFGYEEKDTNGVEVVAQKFTAVTSDEIGILCLNRGTYGSSFINNTMCLTLLRSPAYSSHPIGDRIYTSQDRVNPRIDMGERQYKFKFILGNKTDLLETAEQKAQAYAEQPMAVTFYPSGKGQQIKELINIENSKIILSHLSYIDENTVFVRLFNGTDTIQKTKVKSNNILIGNELEFNAFTFKSFTFNYKENTLVEEKKLY